MTRVKICGIRNEEEIGIINRCRPDYVGFVFAGSRRRVSHEEAFALRGRLAPGIKAVGVFVNEPADAILQLVRQGVIDMIQLHGDEDEAMIEQLRQKAACPVIKAVRVKSTEQVLAAEKLPCDMLLLDSFHQGSRGGSGKSFDHSLIPPLRKPFFLAGGLNAGNVAQCILKCRPFGVDVSTGAETDGTKDEDKIMKILATVSGLVEGVIE